MVNDSNYIGLKFHALSQLADKFFFILTKQESINFAEVSEIIANFTMELQ